MFLFINKVEQINEVIIGFELFKLNERYEIIEKFYFEEPILDILNQFKNDNALNLLGIKRLKELILTKHKNQNIELNDINYIFYNDYDILKRVFKKLNKNIKNFDLIDLNTMRNLMVVNGLLLKHEKPDWIQLIKTFNYKF